MFILVTVLIAFFIADVLLGSVKIPVKEVLLSVFSDHTLRPEWRTILLSFRIPKAITAILAGVALAISGLQMQTYFRNPLAGPYVLGISAGASLGVAILVLGSSMIFILLFSLVLHFVILWFNFGLSLLLKLDRGSMAAFTIHVSQKTLTVSFVVWSGYFSSYALGLVPVIFYHLVQLIVDTFVAHRFRAAIEGEVSGAK